MNNPRHLASTHALSFLLVAACAANLNAADSWLRPFRPDPHTVALYHFDEGSGNHAHDAMGDPKLTLQAYEQALWGKRAGFGTTARFDRHNDHLLIGPTNNDKLHLRTCVKEWTVEAWVRYTGPGGKDRANSTAVGNGYTFANICGTDEEGAGLFVSPIAQPLAGKKTGKEKL